MTKIRYKSASISDNPELKAPKFNFSQYDSSGNTAYCNNEEIIDFVTDGNSLYVCVVPSVRPTKENIAEQEGFLKLVSQGPQGIRGPKGEDGTSAVTPKIDASFDDDQLRIRVNGETKALSPSLTGPTWKPVLEDNILTWELTDDRYMPESVDLMNLRPIQKSPLLLRTNSDNTKLSDEASGPANFIQWKYEGDPYWTNLISISELMNLALAGVSIWKATDGKWHFGHREVVRANYISDKNGRKIISNVRLGDVLFDAGELPFAEHEGSNDYGTDIDLIYQKLEELELAMVKSVNTIGPDPATGNVNLGNLVKSVNNVLPDPVTGNVQLTLGDFIDLTPYVKKSDLATINGAVLYNGGNITINDGQTAGLQDIQFRIDSGKLQYRKQTNGSWGSYYDIMNISSTSGGEHVELTIHDGQLWISYNNGAEQSVGEIGGIGNDPLAFTGAALVDGNILRLTRRNGTTVDITLPTSGDPLSGLTEAQVKHLVGQILEGILDEAIPEYVKGNDHNYFIRLSELENYTTVSQVAAMIRDAMTENNVDYYRVFTLYQRTDSPTVAPSLPVLGVWEWDTDPQHDYLALKQSASSAWENHPSNATNATPYLWMTSATYSYLTKSEVGNWEPAICLTGEPGATGANGFDGTDGADGNGIEFIFTLVRDMNDKPLVNIPVAPADQGEDDIPTGWEDHPQGIGYYLPSEVTTTLSNLSNEETLFGLELASMRKYNGEQWSAYCEPFIWSMWGEDGIDGDGVEYVFFVADENSVEINTTTGKVSLPVATYYVPGTSPNFIPTTQAQVNELGSSYQVADWIQVADNNWTDNPSDVDTTQPFEFVSIRKYHDETGWGPFCTPRLWSHYGGITVNPVETIYQNGVTVYSPYKCYAFYRANETDNTLHADLSNYRVVYDFSAFGDQSNPNPSYSDLTTEQQRLFYEHPEVYAKTMNGNTQVNITWHDTVPSGDGQLWLITAHIGDENDPLTDTGWASPSRWGDKAGFNVEYCANKELGEAVYLNPSLINAHNMTFNDYSGTDEEREALWEADMLTAGYGVWSDNVEDPVYMATTVLVEGVWSNWTIAKIKGEQGIPGNDGLPGTPGSDGKSIEFVYYRTNGAEPGIEFVNELERGTYAPESASSRPKVNKDPERDDFFPAVTNGSQEEGAYWHDHPSGVTDYYTHEWVATRTSANQDGVRYWPNNFSISLWSKYGDRGRDGDGIEYVFWGLTEEQNSQINCTWPTQKVSNVENGGCNVDPTRTYGGKSIGDNEYLPAILINNQKVPAVDDNPGIENYRYVYASMRRYNGETRTWGEFSEIKLWNEQNNTAPDVVLLDIKDDTHPVVVDENGRITDRYMNSTNYSTDGMYLYKNMVLLNCGDVYIQGNSGDVKIAEIIPNAVANNAYNKISNASATVTSHGVTATITPYYVWKYEDSLHSTVQLRVAFNQSGGQNPVLSESFDIVIKVQSSDGTCIGTDVMRLVPTTDDSLTLLHVPNTQRTSAEGEGDYSDSEFNFYGWYGDSYTPLSLIEQTKFFFKYDDQTNWTVFYIPSNNSDLVSLRNSVDGYQEGGHHFYLNRSGSVINSSSGAFFEIWMYNRDWNDNIHGQWTNWSVQAYVKPAAFVASDDYPINELYFGIGFGNTPSDEANVHIIYPGQDGTPGDPGQNGKYKKELYSLGDVNSQNATFQSAWKSSPGVTIATLTNAGWSATKPTVTSQYPHIWMTRADVTIGAESTEACIWEEPTRITPVDGTIEVQHVYQYLDGTVMRVSEWSDGVTGTTKYWNGSTRVISNNGVESASGNDTGTKYLDVVSVTTTTNGVTKTDWYKCKTNHTKSATAPANDSTNWEEFAIMGDAAFQNLLVQNSAFIESLTSRQVVITNGSGANTTIVGGMTSGSLLANIDGLDDNVNAAQVNGGTTENVRIWAGEISKTGGVDDLTTAPFKVMDNGHLYATNATISGDITANRITVTEGNTSSSIQIVFGNSSILDNPDANTLYFIY